ncbi:TetR/AcrR family transcriptional regulator C-terminal domain-containing protein [Actinoplanes sp. TFC3]|uniref:TetR family transcriptional regulator n=1 Tax=Actinoplanes sp. TFC3 TaxID=1710355 RepID=UPI00083292EA|nr:TetR/AcrR family transcriptional regulator C-terminal domain-containing protein [Actinoplanes sp. TFC3]
MAARTDALSRERIVSAAIAMLDDTGETGLTFRALAARLTTGPGALYWHVANKGELLAAATDAVLAGALAADATEQTPQHAIRTAAVGVFDAITAHPWVGAQLSGLASPSAVREVFERLGRQVQALGVPPSALFHAASALLNYVLGVAAQHAANARAVEPGTTRPAILEAESAAWTGLDPAAYPFLHTVAGELREHDDREQFLAGIDLILTGITAQNGPCAS